MTAKAIDDRLIEVERDFPTGASVLFYVKDGKTPPSFEIGRKKPFDFADSEKGFTFASTIRR